MRFTIEGSVQDEAHLRTFMSFLEKIQDLGETGEHELVSIFVGDLKFKFTSDLSYIEEHPERSRIGYVYDPG